MRSLLFSFMFATLLAITALFYPGLQFQVTSALGQERDSEIKDIDSARVKGFKVTYMSSLDGCTVDINLPQLVDAVGDPLDDTIDFKGETKVNDTLRSIFEIVETQIFDICEPQGMHKKVYKIHHNRDGLLSIWMKSSATEFGDPMALEIEQGLNFQYHTGKVLRLSDVLTGEYKNYLVDLLTRAAKAKGYEDATPFVDDDTQFYLTEAHLVIILDVDYPPVHVPIAYSRLNPFLHKNVQKFVNPE